MIGLLLYLVSRHSTRFQGAEFDFEGNFDALEGKLTKKPSRYWLIGFKDRRLESAYQNKVASLCPSVLRVITGYSCMLMFMVLNCATIAFTSFACVLSNCFPLVLLNFMRLLLFSLIPKVSTDFL